MRRILLMTPIYPDISKESTPVVHYFTREWVKLGYDVVVIHYAVNFPKLFCMMASLVKEWLSSITGTVVRVEPLSDATYVIDGVKVCRICMNKYFPHTPYSDTVVMDAYHRTISFLNEVNFVPDYIIGHWFNPQIVLMSLIKNLFHVPTCLVLHDSGRDMRTIFKRHSDKLMNDVDVLGFRSWPIKWEFERLFSYKKPSFMCYSGIPSSYTHCGIQRMFAEIHSFIYVGRLVKRKFPAEIMRALASSYSFNEQFRVTYIGSGGESKTIRNYARKTGREKSLRLIDYCSRDMVYEELRKSEVFIMISKNETFGLVYLEAMAAGCITIASKNEGFDGIIVDGVNGFLCTAGDYFELSTIVSKIRSLSVEELNSISLAAQETARKLTDTNVAKFYIDSVQKLCAFPHDNNKLLSMNLQ